MAAYSTLKECMEDLYADYDVTHILKAMRDVAQQRYEEADRYDRIHFMLGRKPLAPRWALNIMALDKVIKELET